MWIIRTRSRNSASCWTSATPPTASSSGTLFTQYQNAVALYNQRTSEYNARCADRPRNPLLLNQVQATLVCPAGP